ncbi:MAG: hypothetical protein NC337_04515 [Roseburia sp.]|nr:hypothetical protein [Roseburia sp.]
MKNKFVICLTGMSSFGIGFVLGGKTLAGMINDYKKRMDRNLSNMMLFNDWLEFVYSGNSIEQYFHNHGYKKIMVYGNGYIGKRLIQALSDTDIEVVAIMDKSAPSNENEFVIGVDSAIPEVDCIVVTPIFYYGTIYDMLQERTNVPIVSMWSVIDRWAEEG